MNDSFSDRFVHALYLAAVFALLIVANRLGHLPDRALAILLFAIGGSAILARR
jgi:hypothetical protein